MPEGPEVKRTAILLSSFWVGQRLIEVKVLGGRYSKKPEAVNLLVEALPLKVMTITSKGKFLYWIFREKEILYLTSLFNTFGMSGFWSSEKQSHARIEFIREDGKSVFFHDQRNFGTFKYTRDLMDLDKKLGSLGPDVLRNNWVPLESFQEKFKKGKNNQKTLAELLMNQKIFSGIGNYLKAEILWMAELSPHRTPESLGEDEWKLLHSLCHIIPSESLYHGRGSSIMTYRAKMKNSDLQYPQGNLAVYRRKKDPEGREIIPEETKDKRTTHWVPDYQK